MAIITHIHRKQILYKLSNCYKFCLRTFPVFGKVIATRYESLLMHYAISNCAENMIKHAGE